MQEALITEVQLSISKCRGGQKEERVHGATESITEKKCDPPYQKVLFFFLPASFFFRCDIIRHCVKMPVASGGRVVARGTSGTY